MSGANAFSRPVPKIGPIEERLRLEDNKRISRFIGTGQVAGAWFLAWALTVTPFIHPDLYPDEPRHREDTSVTTFRPPPRLPRPDARVTKVKPRENNAAAPTSRHPVKESGQIKLAEIVSKTDDWSKSAFGIIKNALKNVDQEKIEGAGRLTKTDPTRIAGRKAPFSDEFNGSFSETGNGKGTDLGLDIGSHPGRIEGGKPKGGDGISDLKASEITTSQEGRFRSSESILAVVRSHSPGLRHLYNTHLKSNPGLGGKVTVRFAISPSGRVVDAAIVSGTTGSRAFEIQVVERIQAWHFDPIKTLGNDIVTVPFNFSE